jgi:hypothetical protein
MIADKIQKKSEVDMKGFRIQLIAIGVVMSMVTMGFSSCALNIRALPGEVLTDRYNCVDNVDGDKGIGVFRFSDESCQRIPIDSERGFIEAVYNEDRSKVLLLKNADRWNEKPDDYIIYEYDVKSGQLTGLVRNRLKISKSFGLHFSNIRYVPKSKAISYIWRGMKKSGLYIFDKNIGKEELMEMDEPRSYNWSKDGKFILMDLLGEEPEDHIYKYNLTTKEKTMICNGVYPVYSHNNDYIAYYYDNKKGAETIAVRELSTGKEWYYTNPRGLIPRYGFSPDDRYILLIEQYNDWLSYAANSAYHDAKVWEFKTGATGLWLQNKGYFYFDWR